MGSAHSALGFLLATSGFCAIGLGAIVLQIEGTPSWLRPVPLVWGIVAFSLGFRLRKRQPGNAVWQFSCFWLGFGILASMATWILGI